MVAASRVGLVLVLAGTAAVLSPLALFSFHDAHYLVGTDPNGLAHVSDVERDEVVSYGNLSRTEQRAIEPRPSPVIDYARPRGEPPAERHDVFTGAEWRDADALGTHEYVEYRGGYYPVEVRTFSAVPRTGAAGYAMFLVPLGAVLIAVGGLVAYARGLRPVTPTRSLWVLLAAGLALLGVQWLDGIVFPGGSTTEAFPGNGLVLGAAALVVPGSALVRRDRWAGLGGAGLLLAIALYHRSVEPDPHPDAWILILALGVPFLVLGAVLTRPERSRGDGED